MFKDTYNYSYTGLRAVVVQSRELRYCSIRVSELV
jgi:hypothetical protein